jgi:hypothetical protein
VRAKVELDGEKEGKKILAWVVLQRGLAVCRLDLLCRRVTRHVQRAVRVDGRWWLGGQVVFFLLRGHCGGCEEVRWEMGDEVVGR